MSFLLRVGAGSFICLLPLAIYLLYLARLNSRRRPTLVSGRWDFAFLLLGLSGFLLVGGPLLVSVLDSTWRGILFSGDFKHISDAWEANSVIWSTVAGAYLFVLIALIALFMVLRQPVSVVYNVPAGAMSELIEMALRNRGLHWKQGFGGIEIGRLAGDPTLPPVAIRYGATAFLAVDSFSSMCHATLRWRHADPGVRADVEAELAAVLATVEATDNPAVSWLTTAAVSLFVLVVGWLGFLAWMLTSRPRGL